MYSLR
jgi:hypothetical protein